MLEGKVGAYPTETPFRCSVLGLALALPTNIRLGWKGLPGTNALDYYERLQLTAVKSLITLATDDNLIKLFFLRQVRTGTIS